jgi:hypothetical protein
VVEVAAHQLAHDERTPVALNGECVCPLLLCESVLLCGDRCAAVAPGARDDPEFETGSCAYFVELVGSRSGITNRLGRSSV